MSAIRKLAAEAADNGLLAPEYGPGHQPREERQIDGQSRRELDASGRRSLSPPISRPVGGLQITQLSRFFSAAASDGPEVAALTFAHVQERNGRLSDRLLHRNHLPEGVDTPLYVQLIGLSPLAAGTVTLN